MFTVETFRFLEDLAEHNDRAWFEANRSRYEAHCREPALAFVRAMAPRLARIAPRFRADDRKLGGSLMRLHRDTRFGANKAPYKTNLGIQFRHEGGADVHAPGIYVHLQPPGSSNPLDAPAHCFLGVGTWMPEPPVLAAIRERLVADPDTWRAAVAPLDGWDTDGGERLKRPPKGFDPEHPLVEQLKKKSHLAMRRLSVDEVLGDGFDARVSAHLERSVPYLGWLTEAVGAPFGG